MKRIFVALLLATCSLFASDFVDTQVTFTYSDDNIFETSRRSPFARIGEIDDELFNENLNTIKTGDETETQLVVYKKIDGFIKNLSVETAFVLELSLFSNETGESWNRLKENGSYIRVNYGTENNKIVVTAFPFNAERFLLGFTYDLSWGGQSFWPKSKINKTTPVPGIKFDYTNKTGSLESNIFVGAKTRPYNVNIIEKDNNGEEYINNTVATTWAILGGGYLDFMEQIRLDAHFGRFYKGTNPLNGATELKDDNVLGKRIYADGVAVRLSYRQNYDLSVSNDMTVYKNLDPRTELDSIEKKDETPTEEIAIVKPNFGYMISLEGVYLSEPLRDADNRNAIIDFNGIAGDFKVKTYYGNARVNVDFIYRNVPFLLFNVPGFTAFEGISEDSATTRDELMFSIGGDYKVADHLRIGVLYGFKRPATYKAKGTDNIIVIKDREDMSAFASGLSRNKVKLPNGEAAKDIHTAKIMAIYELADGVTLTGEISYLNDKNDTEMINNQIEFRSTDETQKVGFAIILQSIF
ncbi:hypothetical protein JXR93_09635 [bacterium]|nr:hypothetical protein [bacterium]